jgi:hypothetical protein
MGKSIGDIPLGQIKQFEITGILKNGKRFNKIIINSYEQACMYNLWNGSVWIRLENNTRRLLKRVIN